MPLLVLVPSDLELSHPVDAQIQILIFFFQAEDGIRYHCVTGVQTCALPICFNRALERAMPELRQLAQLGHGALQCAVEAVDGLVDFAPSNAQRRRERDDFAVGRSEERRVGKEGRSRWSPYH